jgi:uncharacterized protein (TIGR03083 family)
MGLVTMRGPTDPTTIRDPERPERLLRAECDALLPILRRTPDEAFDTATACPGWSVRDVLAHCGAALTRVATDRLHDFTPELNQIDVDERRDWPLPDVLSELARGYLEAGPVIGAAGGRLDAISLGEWVHGGDVRAALGQPAAYSSQGFEDACGLLRDWTRSQAIPLIEVRLPDATLVLGVPLPGRANATLRTGNAAMIKLFAGRPVDPADYQLAGATAKELVVF